MSGFSLQETLYRDPRVFTFDRRLVGTVTEMSYSHDVLWGPRGEARVQIYDMTGDLKMGVHVGSPTVEEAEAHLAAARKARKKQRKENKRAKQQQKAARRRKKLAIKALEEVATHGEWGAQVEAAKILLELPVSV